jgi:hypothetical protein
MRVRVTIEEPKELTEGCTRESPYRCMDAEISLLQVSQGGSDKLVHMELTLWCSVKSFTCAQYRQHVAWPRYPLPNVLPPPNRMDLLCGPLPGIQGSL